MLLNRLFLLSLCLTICLNYKIIRTIYIENRALVGKPEGRRPIGRPRRRWEDNIKMDLREVGWGAWTGSFWLRASSCECGYEPSGSIKCGEFLE
jgi:hypothetical protein